MPRFQQYCRNIVIVVLTIVGMRLYSHFGFFNNVGISNIYYKVEVMSIYLALYFGIFNFMVAMFHAHLQVQRRDTIGSDGT